jgi:uncharacterized membrane protein
MDRWRLSNLAAQLKLSSETSQWLLRSGDFQPNRAQWLQWAERLCLAAGVTSLAASMIFFIAANWSRFGHLSKFAGLQALLLACLAAALWKRPPHLLGRYALVFAIVISGTLLALFGQTYQTGANVYELFFGWAALCLPMAFAARALPAWVFWLVIFNTGAMLYLNHRAWWFDLYWIRPALMSALHVIAFLSLSAGGERWMRLDALDFRRLQLLLMLIALGYALVAAMYSLWEWSGAMLVPVIGYGMLAFALVRFAFQRSELLLLAAVTSSAIAFSVALILRMGRGFEIGLMFLVTLWLIVTLSASSVWLMNCAKRFKQSDADHSGDAP